MNTRLTKAEHAIAFVREIKDSNGTKLFAGAGFTLREMQQAFPYALIVNHDCDIFKMLMYYNEIHIMLALVTLQTTPEITWVGTPHYIREEGKVYCEIQFRVNLPDRQDEELSHE